MTGLFKNSFANVRKIAAFGIVCTLLFAVVSCESAENDEKPYADDEIVKKVPGDFFTGSKFRIGTDCRLTPLWFELPYDGWAPDHLDININRVVIINSSEELRKYIECANGNYPAIDFSKYSLLLAFGTTTTVVHDLRIGSFQQLSTNKYKLAVERCMTGALAPDIWFIALVTSKLSERSEIELNVTNNCYW